MHENYMKVYGSGVKDPYGLHLSCRWRGVFIFTVHYWMNTKFMDTLRLTDLLVFS
jgi:hypothetical protein